MNTPRLTWAVLSVALLYGASCAKSSDEEEGVGGSAEWTTSSGTGGASSTSSSSSTSSGIGGSSSSSSSSAGTGGSSSSSTSSSSSSSTSTSSSSSSSTSTSGAGGCGGSGTYTNTITIDGINDFEQCSDELSTSSSPTYLGYVAWDATDLYVGMEGTDIASGDGCFWLLVYLSGASGTNTGIAMQTQQPSFPSSFSAKYVIRWKADGLYQDAWEYSGSSWTITSWNVASMLNHNGDYIEMKIPFTQIGASSPGSVNLHMSMICECDNTTHQEWSYAAVPATSFTDGLNPSYSQYYSFQLGGSTKPSEHSALP